MGLSAEKHDEVQEQEYMKRRRTMTNWTRSYGCVEVYFCVSYAYCAGCVFGRRTMDAGVIGDISCY